MSIEKFTDMIGNSINKAAHSGGGFVYGIIKNVTPLIVKVDGLPDLKSDLLILGYIAKHQGIKIGDKVFMIKQADNQKFYVMEVIENDTSK